MNLQQRSAGPISGDKQLIRRTKLGLVMRFLLPVASIVNSSYKLISHYRTGVQAAAKQILGEAIRGEYPNLEIDFSKVILIRGQLASPGGTMTHPQGSGKLNFSWSICSQCNSNRNDELLALIYCSSLSEFWCDLNLGIQRSDEFCTIQVPQNFAGREIHVWLAYRSVDQRSFSDSVYVGGGYEV